MAVDTRDKRFAMMNLNMSFLGFPHPLADGSVDQPDRQQFLWGYPGITWAGAIVVAAVVKAIVSPITMTGAVLLPTPGLRRRAFRGIIR